jgi:hypothetical protein
MTLIDSEGITVETQPGVSQRVLWDQIRDVDAVHPDARLDEFLPLAEDLWRARSRLQRHDARTAEPLFERLFERYHGQTHESALVVAEGLLRCRLARDELMRAVLPALEVARLRMDGIETDSYATLPAIFDEATALCTMLPPGWMHEVIGGGGLTPVMRDQLAAALSEYDAQGNDVVAAIAELYRQSIVREDIGALRADREVQRHPGVRLLRDIVQMGAMDSGPREAARARLLREASNLPDWAEAWARFHSGASLLKEADASRADRGAVHLSHLPARFAQRQPYLAGLAIATLAEMYDSRGNTSAAESLRSELVLRFPNHPIVLANR